MLFDEPGSHVRLSTCLLPLREQELELSANESSI